jgi:hypothetical protein
VSQATKQHTTTRPAPSMPTLRYGWLLHAAADRLDCAITALGCVAKELQDGGDASSEAAAVAYLYGVLREETLNLRNCLGTACGCQGGAP